jgi:hypothetical protein
MISFRPSGVVKKEGMARHKSQLPPIGNAIARQWRIFVAEHGRQPALSTRFRPLSTAGHAGNAQRARNQIIQGA